LTYNFKARLGLDSELSGYDSSASEPSSGSEPSNNTEPSAKTEPSVKTESSSETEPCSEVGSDLDEILQDLEIPPHTFGDRMRHEALAPGWNSTNAAPSRKGKQRRKAPAKEEMGGILKDMEIR
jgi:hypothetical protein